MRTGGRYLSQVGGHWRDLSEWRGRIPELAFTLDTSHAALFRSFASAYPALFEVERPEELELARDVGELGAATRVAHVSNARGLLGEGLPYGSGELDLDPTVRRLGEVVPYIVAEINEPDPARSVEMKNGYVAIESALDIGAVREIDAEVVGVHAMEREHTAACIHELARRAFRLRGRSHRFWQAEVPINGECVGVAGRNAQDHRRCVRRRGRDRRAQHDENERDQAAHDASSVRRRGLTRNAICCPSGDHLG